MPSGKSTKFIYYDRCIFVKVSVNGGRELLVLLDTGASASAIDQATATTLKLPTAGDDTVEGTTGAIAVGRGHIRSMAIGNCVVRDMNVTVQDLSGTLSPPGSRVGGILGYDFLKGFALTIDFADSLLTLRSKPVKVSPERSEGVSFDLDNGIPRLHAMLDDSVAADLRLDTGASLFATDDIYINITGEIWSRLRWADSTLAPEQYFKGNGPAGEVSLPVARINKLRIGRLELQRPFVIVQPAAGYFLRADAAGFIGNNLLEKYTPVTIDYRQRMLYLSINN